MGGRDKDDLGISCSDCLYDEMFLFQSLQDRRLSIVSSPLMLPKHLRQLVYTLPIFATRLVVLHISGSRIELQVPLDDLINRTQEILLSGNLPSCTDSEHSS